MANDIVSEVVQETQSSNDITTSETETTEKIEFDDAIGQLVAQRKAEHPEWYGEPVVEEQLETQDSAEVEEVVETEEVQESEPAEQAGDTDSEPESKALSRILKRESKLREEAEKLAEFKDKIAEFEKAKQFASIDPVSFLKTLGIDQENFIDIAKELYYESLGELAPDEYRGQKETLALKRKIEQLENRLEKKPESDEDQQKKALVAYQETLLDAAKVVDTAKFPTVAKVLDAYSERDVAADMYRVAYEYAVQNNGQGQPLTPEQCLVQVEAKYAELFGKLNPGQNETAETKKVKTPAKKTSTLSNKMQTSVPPGKSVKDMSYEEIAAQARANFRKALGEG